VGGGGGGVGWGVGGSGGGGGGGGGGGTRLMRVGLPDRYVTHGAPPLLHEEVGFTSERIAERVLAAVAERSGVAHS